MGKLARQVLEVLSTSPTAAGPVVEQPTPARPLEGRHREAISGDAGQEPIAAVQVWSAVLEQAVQVVADDLSAAAWPTDAPVYTHTEVKRLLQVGCETLALVQALKEMFNGRVVAAQRRAKPVQPQEPDHRTWSGGETRPTRVFPWSSGMGGGGARYAVAGVGQMRRHRRKGRDPCRSRGCSASIRVVDMWGMP